MKASIVFLRQSFSSFADVGAVWSSSKWAAEGLTEPMDHLSGPRDVLEVGAGVGPVTVDIISKLKDGDHLTVCEINPKLMVTLKERLQKLPEYQKRKEQIEFFIGPVQDLVETRKFDVIVCALPFLNFDQQTIADIFNKLLNLAKPKCTMTYIQYIGFAKLGRLFGSPARKERIRSVNEFIAENFLPRLIKKERIWLNIPALDVMQLDLGANSTIN